MLHPAISKAIRYLLIASGTLFALLTAVTVMGVVLIVMNGGVV